MLDMEYWECPECKQRVTSNPREASKEHVCMSKRPPEEIHAIIDKVLDSGGNGKKLEELAKVKRRSKAKEKIAVAESKAEVVEPPLPEVSEITEEAIPEVEEEKVILHITLADEMVGEMEMLAGYAAEIGAIHKGNGSSTASFVAWCIDLGGKSLKQYAVRRRESLRK